MAKAKGRCKICDKVVHSGSKETPPDIAAEGIMEGIQEHIYQEHCDDDFNLIEGDYDNVSEAWEYL
jgi:hypothetical protein